MQAWLWLGCSCLLHRAGPAAAQRKHWRKSTLTSSALNHLHQSACSHQLVQACTRLRDDALCRGHHRCTADVLKMRHKAVQDGQH